MFTIDFLTKRLDLLQNQKNMKTAELNAILGAIAETNFLIDEAKKNKTSKKQK